MYKLIKIKNGGKAAWYYFLDRGDYSSLNLRLCPGCESKDSARDFVLRLKNEKSLVKTITAGMYEKGSFSYEKRRQFGKSVYKATLEQKKLFLRQINKDFGDFPIQDISEKDVESRLLMQGKSGSWKNSYLETFLDIYKEARWNGIKVPLPSFQKFKRNSKKADVLTDFDIKALFSPGAFSDEGMRLMFKLGLCCGLRLGEMRGARARQIIQAENAFVVDGYINKIGERTNYNKKGSAEKPKFRVAFMPQKLREELESFIERNKLCPDDFLFQSNGKAVSQISAYRAFVKAVKKAGLSIENRKIVPHSLRYTYITRLRSALPGETVRKLAGHSSIEMTDYYTRAALTDLIQELSPTQNCVELRFSGLL
ncbi:MAG: site-specific integrase [Treponema sp.]|nr:site-specific integrase [Treponema sp.]